MIKILLVDDHSLVRECLNKILKEEEDIIVVASADGYQQAITGVCTFKPDIIVMDISMPGKDGLELLKEIKLGFPEVRVLILSMHPEQRFGVSAIKAGAAGYLTKESVGRDL